MNAPRHSFDHRTGKRLVREAGRGLAPCSAFGPEGEGYVCWCFAASQARLADGVARLGRFLRAG